jgi:hypothetical protein
VIFLITFSLIFVDMFVDIFCDHFYDHFYGRFFVVVCCCMFGGCFCFRPKGSPGMPEMLSPGAALVGAGLGKDVALVTDGTCPRVP